MQKYCESLSSKTLNWNSYIGSLSALSLNRKEPAVNLHSYKFYLSKAIWFEIIHDGQKIEPEKAEILWYPHKMRGIYFFPGFVLDLDAFFIDDEVFTISYKLSNKSDADFNLEVLIYGIARNGQDRDKYFRYEGRVDKAGVYAVIKQEVDIPDYRMKPIVSSPLHKHYMFWLIDAGVEIEVTENEIETEHDFSPDGVNKSNFWHTKKLVTLGSLQETSEAVFVGIRWMGIEEADKDDIRDLKRKICSYRDYEIDLLEKKQAEFWNNLLSKVPMVKERYRDISEYMELYLMAWTCVWQNITGSLVTSRKTIKGSSAFVGKVSPNGFGPAQWETSLVGMLVSYMNSDLGIKIIESVLNSIEEDGFIPEDLIFNRDVHLPTAEAFLLEQIYRRTRKTDFLERNYEKLYKQLYFHIRHPSFYYLSTEHSFESYIYSYYSLLSMEKIAIAIGKDSSEIKKLRTLKKEVESGIENTLNKKEDSYSMYFKAIYNYLEGERLTEVINQLKDHHIPPEGRFFIYAKPDGEDDKKDDKKDDKLAIDTYKMVHYLFFIPGLEKLHEDELLDTIIRKTFEGLKACGDFYEAYYYTGEPWGNGPMGIFGAFGWIWCLMEK